MYYLTFNRHVGISQAPRFTKQFKETIRLIWWVVVVLAFVMSAWAFTVLT